MLTEGCPPERLAAERAVVYVAMFHGAEHVTPHLEARHFFDASRRHIFEAVLALSVRSDPVDITSVAGELARAGHGDSHALDELLACAESFTAATNAAHHCRAVRDWYVRSEAAKLGLALVERPGPDELEAIASRLTALHEESGASAGRVSLSEAAHAFVRLEPERLRVPESLLGDGLLCRSDLAVLSGRPRRGKSRLLIELAVAAACGEPWLGLPTGRPARVGYLAAEFTAYRFLERCVQLFGFEPHTNGPASLLEAYRSLGLGRDGGCLLPVPSDLGNEPLNLLSDASVRGLERFVTDFALELVILDPLGRLMGGADETNEFFGKVVESLDRVRFGTGCALLVAHHERKESKETAGAASDPLDAVRGGTKITDFANTVMRVRASNVGKLNILSFPKANFAQAPEDMWLSIPEDGGRTVVEPSPEERGNANLTRIAEWAAKQADRFTARQAADACGMTEKPAREHLKKLAARGLVKDSVGPRKATFWQACDGSREQAGGNEDSRHDDIAGSRFDL